MRGARGEEGVGGGGRSKNLEHAVHLPEAGGGGFMSCRTAADLSRHFGDPHGTAFLLESVDCSIVIRVFKRCRGALVFIVGSLACLESS